MNAELNEAEQQAARNAIVAWQAGEDGARERLNKILASWAAQHLPLTLKDRYEIADAIAMTVTAGISPYLENAVLQLSAKVREVLAARAPGGYRDRAGIDNRANAALLEVVRIATDYSVPTAVRLARVAERMALEPILTDTSPAACAVRREAGAR